MADRALLAGYPWYLPCPNGLILARLCYSEPATLEPICWVYAASSSGSWLLGHGWQTDYTVTSGLKWGSLICMVSQDNRACRHFCGLVPCHLYQATVTDLKIGYNYMKSTGTPSSKELKWLHLKTGHPDINSWDTNLVITKSTKVMVLHCIIWARWRLKSPASRLFAQPFVQAQIKENIKVPCHWPLWGVDSPNKGPVTRKMFPLDDVIMSTVRGH